MIRTVTCLDVTPLEQMTCCGNVLDIHFSSTGIHLISIPLCCVGTTKQGKLCITLPPEAAKKFSYYFVSESESAAWLLMIFLSAHIHTHTHTESLIFDEVVPQLALSKKSFGDE